jgi:hypothetical protein
LNCNIQIEQNYRFNIYLNRSNSIQICFGLEKLVQLNWFYFCLMIRLDLD